MAAAATTATSDKKDPQVPTQTIDVKESTVTYTGSGVARIWSVDDVGDWSCGCSSLTIKTVVDSETGQMKQSFSGSFPCLTKRWSARCFKCGAVQPFPPTSVNEIHPFRVGQLVSVKLTALAVDEKDYPRDRVSFRILNLIESKQEGVDSLAWLDLCEIQRDNQPFICGRQNCPVAKVVSLSDLVLPTSALSTDNIGEIVAAKSTG